MSQAIPAAQTTNSPAAIRQAGKLSGTTDGQGGKLSVVGQEGLPSISRPSTPAERMRCWSDSWADEPMILWPDLPAELEAALPEAVEQVRLQCEPGDAGEVLAALTSLATRRGFPLPDEISLMMDVQVMAAWPKDLFAKAFARIWETFRYRRLPEPADFRAHIETDLAERQASLFRIESVRMKLETLAMKRRWDRQATEQRKAMDAARRDLERAEMRTAYERVSALEKTPSGKVIDAALAGGMNAAGHCFAAREADLEEATSEHRPECDAASKEKGATEAAPLFSGQSRSAASGVPDAVVDVGGHLVDVFLRLGETQHHVGPTHAAFETAGPGIGPALLTLAVEDVPVELLDEAPVIESAVLHLEFGRSGVAVGGGFQGHAAPEGAGPAAEARSVGQAVEHGVVEPVDLRRDAARFGDHPAVGEGQLLHVGGFHDVMSCFSQIGNSAPAEDWGLSLPAFVIRVPMILGHLCANERFDLSIRTGSSQCLSGLSKMQHHVVKPSCSHPAAQLGGSGCRCAAGNGQQRREIAWDPCSCHPDRDRTAGRPAQADRHRRRHKGSVRSRASPPDVVFPPHP
jgi:hypothetical protein